MNSSNSLLEMPLSNSLFFKESEIKPIFYGALPHGFHHGHQLHCPPLHYLYREWAINRPSW